MGAEVPPVGQSLINLTKEVNMLCSEVAVHVCFLVCKAGGRISHRRRKQW